MRLLLKTKLEFSHSVRQSNTKHNTKTAFPCAYEPKQQKRTSQGDKSENKHPFLEALLAQLVKWKTRSSRKSALVWEESNQTP